MTENFDSRRGGWVNLLGDPLVQHQLVTPGIWLIAVNFWILQFFALLCSSQWYSNGFDATNEELNNGEGLNNIEIDLTSISDPSLSPRFLTWSNLLGLVQTSVLISFVQVLLVIARFPQTTVRRRVRSKVITLLRACACHILCHALHFIAGAVLVSLFQSFLELHFPLKFNHDATNSFYCLCGAVSGAAFSLFYSIYQRGQLEFPALQQRRSFRVRALLLSSVTTSFFRAIFSLFLVIFLFDEKSSDVVIDDSDAVGAEYRYSSVILLSWVVHTMLDISHGIFSIMLTESKRTGLSSWFPMSEAEEIRLLSNTVCQCENGSIEQALMSFSFSQPPVHRSSGLNIANDSRTHRQKESLESRLMEFAKLNELKVMYHKTRSHEQHKEFGSPIEFEPTISDARKLLRKWWSSSCDSTIPCASIANISEQILELRQRRLDAVVQAVYAADANSPGYAFCDVQRLQPLEEVKRARAFLDLKVLSEHSADRRRSLLVDKESWTKVFEACIAAIDAMTLTLRSATQNAAIEPVVPTTKEGVSLVDVFVYKAGVESSLNLNAQQRLSLAWKADFAARSLRRQPWFSLDWWKNIFFSEFRDLDPISEQFLSEMSSFRTSSRFRFGTTNENTFRGSFKEAQRSHFAQNLAKEDDTTANGSKGESDARQYPNVSWNRQYEWKRQFWLSPFFQILVNYFCRDSTERTAALLSNSQVVGFSCAILRNFFLKSKDEESDICGLATYVPVLLGCLLDALIALESYAESCGCGGLFRNAMEIDSHRQCRADILCLHFSLERAIYATSTRYRERVIALKLSEEQSIVLSRYVNFEA